MTLEQITVPQSYILRGGCKHHRHGEPYTFAAVVEVSGTVAEIKGATGKLQDIPAIRAALRSIGVTRATWTRSVGGMMIPHTLEID